MPFFSIITCTYNAGESLRNCIRSVECQCFEDYEHIFVDGFSTDSTPTILDEYAMRAKGRVRVFQSLPQGVTRAMNEGVGFSHGRTILHLHSDDRLADDEVLGRVHAIFQTTDPTVLIGDCLLTGHPSLSHTWPKNRFKRFVTKLCLQMTMFYSNPIAHPSTFLSKSVFDRHGLFDEKYKVVMDYDYWFRILKTEKIRMTDRVLSVYHFHSDTISSKQKALGIREIDEVRRKYRSLYPFAFMVSVLVLRPIIIAGKLLKLTPALFKRIWVCTLLP